MIAHALTAGDGARNKTCWVAVLAMRFVRNESRSKTSRGFPSMLACVTRIPREILSGMAELGFCFAARVTRVTVFNVRSASMLESILKLSKVKGVCTLAGMLRDERDTKLVQVSK